MDTVSKYPFYGLIGARFLKKCLLFVCDSLFKPDPRCSAEGPSTVSDHTEAAAGLREKTPVLEKPHADMSYIVLLAMNSMPINQQYILSKVSLYRNTHKNKIIYGLLRKTVIKVSHEPNSISLQS